MNKKKFYAVRFPIGPIVLNSWEECKILVHGVSGAQYRSFAERENAEVWAYSAESERKIDELKLYVDGSYISGIPYGGWGVVAVKNGKEEWRSSGLTEEPALSRNIDGEVEASIRAIVWLKKNPQPAVICHDYEGIARWITGEWKAKSEVAQRYVRQVGKLPQEVRFEKVIAHSGERWNDLVDLLARTPLLEMKKSL